MKIPRNIIPLTFAFGMFWGSGAMADIKIGVTISATGSGAAIGIPAKNTVALLPPTIAGQPVQYIVLDDASDATRAVSNARKLITVEHVDALIGSSIGPTTFPLVDIAAETKTPLIVMNPATGLVEPMDEKRKWVFKILPHDTLLAKGIADHMAKNGVKTVAFIGFNDAFGENWYAAAVKTLNERGIKIIAKESFTRTDTSVSGQILKIVAAKPDAVWVGASGTPAVLPQKALKERGYKGQIYHTSGVASMDFIRVGGKFVEGAILPAGPIIAASELPDSNPIKKLALDYIQRYEALNKIPYAAFGPHLVDSVHLISDAVPAALNVAKPGTPEFRAALRDGLESAKSVVLINGILSMSPTNHSGYDDRARVMVRVENGAIRLIR